MTYSRGSGLPAAAGLGPPIRGIVFDKDGTLFDFQASWGLWAERFVTDLAAGDRSRAEILARAIRFDLDHHSFLQGSPVIAGTPAEIAEALLEHLPGATPGGLIARMNVLSAEAPMVEAVPLRRLFQGLRDRGLRLGVATNDGEIPAKAHLVRARILDLVDFVAGFDSGHGAKPQPGMLLAFAGTFGLAPAEVLMVGDSRHDLAAGRAAGMPTVAVLSGVAGAAELAPWADDVLPDIGHLPALLDRVQAVA